MYVVPESEGPTRRVEFWITSSRGTNNSEIFDFPEDLDDADIKDELEQWCSQFGAWSASENFISYGFNFEGEFGNRK
jgi:hypothetical protein